MTESPMDLNPHELAGRESFFSCIFCGATRVDVSADAWTCQGCKHAYPVVNGIPVLVRSWQDHEGVMEKARAVKPNWYIDEQSPEQSSPWIHHLRKRREFVELSIEKYLAGVGKPRVKTLLDLGCGDGNHLDYLQKYSESLFGSDYNLLRLVRARARFDRASLFLADILDYPAQNDFYEIIFFNHVIEHIPEDLKALETIHRILRTGGLLILGTPNEGAAWWQLAYKFQPRMLQISDHVHFYTGSSLSEKIAASGFKILELKHMGWGPPHWSLDGLIRRYRMVDDLFELVGKRVVPRQASSLYILATKE